MKYTYEDIAQMIDHSLVVPTLTSEDLERELKVAMDYKVASVCIVPHYLKRCAEVLKGSGVKAGTIVGFITGCASTAGKLAETRDALKNGCEEVDMVSNISRVLSKDWDYVREDIKAIIDVCHAEGRKVKVIFENCYLQDEHKLKLCEICSELEADWVKPSTGYAMIPCGATDHDLQLMLDNTPDRVQVKSSGQSRNLDDMIALRDMGITRIGLDTDTSLNLDEYKRRCGAVV